jgi:lysophospholipase L1-like esterase
MKKRIDIFSIRNLLISFITLILYFSIAEISLRSFDVKNPLNDLEYYASMVFTREEWKEAEKFRDDLLEIGIRGRMIKGTIIYNYKPANSETANFNSFGFRGKEINKKRKSEYRVGIVGASRIWGSFLPDSKTIPYIIENDLKTKFSGMDITIINLGVEGSDLQRGIATAKYFHKDLELDLIVFYGGFTDIGYAYIFGNVDWIPFDRDSDMDEETFRNLIRTIFPNSWWQKSRVVNMILTSAKAELGLTIAKDIVFDDVFGLEIPPAKQQAAKEFPEVFFKRMVDSYEYFKDAGIEQIYILPSSVQVKNPLSEFEKKVIANYEPFFPGYNAFIKECYEGVHEHFGNKELPFTFIDHSDLFDGETETVYFDGMHVSPKGSRKIAESITEILYDFLLKNQLKASE